MKPLILLHFSKLSFILPTNCPPFSCAHHLKKQTKEQWLFCLFLFITFIFCDYVFLLYHIFFYKSSTILSPLPSVHKERYIFIRKTVFYCPSKHIFIKPVGIKICTPCILKPRTHPSQFLSCTVSALASGSASRVKLRGS